MTAHCEGLAFELELPELDCLKSRDSVFAVLRAIVGESLELLVAEAEFSDQEDDRMDEAREAGNRPDLAALGRFRHQGRHAPVLNALKLFVPLVPREDERESQFPTLRQSCMVLRKGLTAKVAHLHDEQKHESNVVIRLGEKFVECDGQTLE